MFHYIRGDSPGNLREHGLQHGLFIDREVLEHEGFTRKTILGITVFDADTYFKVVVSDSLGRRCDAVMDLRTFLGDFKASQRNIQIVVKDENMFGLYLEKLHKLLDRLSRAIHECLGLCENKLSQLAILGIKIVNDLRRLAFGDSIGDQAIDGHKTDIVTMVGIGWTGIPESDKQVHAGIIAGFGCGGEGASTKSS